MATTAELRRAREWVGSGPTDEELTELIDELGDPLAAARSILLRVRADVATGPTGWNAQGDYSQHRSPDGYKALDELIARLEAAMGIGAPSVMVTRIRRTPHQARDVDALIERTC